MRPDEGSFWKKCMFSVLAICAAFIIANLAVAGNEIIDLDVIKTDNTNNSTNVIIANQEIHTIVQKTKLHLYLMVVFNVLLLLCTALLMVFIITAFRPRDHQVYM